MADPFTTGLLAVTAAQNPAVAADALSLIGDSGMPGPLGQLFGGASLGQFLGQGSPLVPAGGNVPFGAGGLAQGLGGFQPPLAANLPGINPGAQVAGAGGELQGNQASQSPLAGLQGFKGPEPVKPQFQGGIRGAQQAPGQNVAGLNPAQLLQALQAAIQPAQGVAPLGQFLGGVR